MVHNLTKEIADKRGSEEALAAKGRELEVRKSVKSREDSECCVQQNTLRSTRAGCLLMA